MNNYLDAAPSFIEALTRLTGPITVGHFATQASSGNPGVVFAVANAVAQSGIAGNMSVGDILAKYRGPRGTDALASFSNRLVEHFGFDLPLTDILDPRLGATPGSGVGVVAAITAGLGILAAAAGAAGAISSAVGAAADAHKKVTSSAPAQPVTSPSAQQTTQAAPQATAPGQQVYSQAQMIKMLTDLGIPASALTGQPAQTAQQAPSYSTPPAVPQLSAEDAELLELLSGSAMGSNPDDPISRFTDSLLQTGSDIQVSGNQISLSGSSFVIPLTDDGINLPHEFDAEIGSVLAHVAKMLGKG